MPFSVYDYHECVSICMCMITMNVLVDIYILCMCMITMNVLVYACVCDPARKRYRSGEVNYVCGYMCQCNVCLFLQLQIR